MLNITTFNNVSIGFVMRLEVSHALLPNLFVRTGFRLLSIIIGKINVIGQSINQSLNICFTSWLFL